MYVNYIPIKLLQKYYSDNGSICFIRIPKASEIRKGLLTLSLYLETYSSQLLPRNLFLGIFPKHCSNISSIKQASSTSLGRSLLLLLLLSHFSRVRLGATPETAAHQAPPSLGFPRQEHWSGLPFPSPVHESEKWKWSRSVVSYPQRPHGLQPSRLLHPWDFPGKSTGVGCHCLLWAGL